MKFMDSEKMMAREVRGFQCTVGFRVFEVFGKLSIKSGRGLDGIAEMQNSFHAHSHTGAMSDSYDMRRRDLDSYINAFLVA